MMYANRHCLYTTTRIALLWRQSSSFSTKTTYWGHIPTHSTRQCYGHSWCLNTRPWAEVAHTPTAATTAKQLPWHVYNEVLVASMQKHGTLLLSCIIASYENRLQPKCLNTQPQHQYTQLYLDLLTPRDQHRGHDTVLAVEAATLFCT